MSSAGNSIDFGDSLIKSAVNSNSSCQSLTRGILGGGTPSNTNQIEYITVQSTGNAVDFGDYTTQTAREGRGSTSTRGVFMGGTRAEPNLSDVIDYITIASTGNAIDFGNLTDARSDVAGCASPIRTVCGGGLTPSRVNLIDWINIPTTGNASDFGDLSEARDHIAGCSNAHGGL